MATPQSEGGGNGNGRATGRTRAAVVDPPADQAGERRGSAASTPRPGGGDPRPRERARHGLDPVSFSKALRRFGAEVARRPLPTIAAVARCGTGLSLTGLAAAGRAVGLKTPGPAPAGGEGQALRRPGLGGERRLLRHRPGLPPVRPPGRRPPGAGRAGGALERQGDVRPARPSSTRSRRPTSWPPTRPRSSGPSRRAAQSLARVRGTS